MFGGWVWFCYGFAVGLPFFFDDLPIMTWVARHSWLDMVFSHENAYYRPLVFFVYKWGQLFPMGVRQPILHMVNLLLLWLSMVLILKIVNLCERRFDVAFLSAALFGGLPFLSESIPWITALPHPLVTFLALFATYMALRGEYANRSYYWVISLIAIALAPLAHENGAVVGVLVSGVVVLQFGVSVVRRRWLLLGLGVLLNGVLVLSRAFLPGVHTVDNVKGLSGFFPNFMYFLHGLLYPLGPIVGWLVRERQWHDFTLLGLFAVLLAMVIGLLVYQSRRWRWIARALWWWLIAAVPSIVSLDYGSLFISKRLYTLSGVGITMFWAAFLIEFAERLVSRRLRTVLVVGLTALLLTQNIGYVRHIQFLYETLDVLYAEVLVTVEDDQAGPFGFVNVPAALIWQDQVYALLADDVIFVPWSYSNLSEFIEVNFSRRQVHVATSRPLFSETEPFWLTQGLWLEGGEMRQFVVEQQTNRLGRFDARTQQFFLEDMGNVFPGMEVGANSLAYYEEGMVLERASIRLTDGADRWQIVLDWWSPGPQDATVFLHVRTAAGAVIAQADGPMLGGTMILQALHPGDRVRDVRYVTLPEGATGPFTVHVGLYRDAYRFPAFVDEVRVLDDAVFVGEFGP